MIILKLLCLLIHIMAFPGLRGLIILFFICITIYDAIKKRKKALVINLCLDLCLIATAFAMMLTHYPLFKSIDFMRFKLLENVYTFYAEELMPDFEEVEEGYWDVYDGGGNIFLSHRGLIYYHKKGEDTVIFFPTDRAFMSGYFYYSTDTGKDIIDNPGKYWTFAPKESPYDYYQPLGDNWTYIHLY